MMASTPGQLLARDEIVSELRLSLSSTEHGLGTVPNAIKVVIRENMWRDRVLRQTGQRVTFASFTDFVTKPPLEGLGATMDQVRGICGKDPEALDFIDRATQNAPSIHTGDVDNVNSRPVGNASATALRRLRKDRPDLHAQVLAKELSPHAAMVEAGFRPKTMTVPSDVEALAATLRRRLNSDDRHHLAVLLVLGDQA